MQYKYIPQVPNKKYPALSIVILKCNRVEKNFFQYYIVVTAMEGCMPKISQHWENAIIIQANVREFRAVENFSYPQVQSCFIMYCVTGGGKI